LRLYLPFFWLGIAGSESVPKIKVLRSALGKEPGLVWFGFQHLT
jgi:hypothetical protein